MEEISIKDLGEIKQGEIELLHWIRTRFRFGEITIIVRDGVPYRIIKAFESQDLG